jgi:hypothetical protein
MFGDELIISIRNILIFHLIILSLAPEKAVLVSRELRKIWNTLHAPILPKTGPVNKGKASGRST